MASETVTFDPDGDLLLVVTAPQEHGTTSDNSDDEAPMTPDEDTKVPKDKPSKEIRLLVSSQTLALVSPVFRAMLRRHAFKEGYDLANGTAEIPLPDDDAIAFQIVLRIIHHHVNLVPKFLDLNTATNVAILADKYQLQSMFPLYSEVWVRNLKNTSPLPLFWNGTTMPWLCIAWVFELDVEFKQMTLILQRGSAGSVPCRGLAQQDLPIPDSIFEAVEADRRVALSQAIEVMSTAIAQFQGPVAYCPTTTFYICPNRTFDVAQKRTACDGMILGTLLKSAASNGLWPAPESPYIDCAWHTFYRRFERLEISSLCDHAEFAIRDHHGNYPYNYPNHGIKDQIMAKINNITNDLAGYRLTEFK